MAEGIWAEIYNQGGLAAGLAVCLFVVTKFYWDERKEHKATRKEMAALGTRMGLKLDDCQKGRVEDLKAHTREIENLIRNGRP